MLHCYQLTHQQQCLCKVRKRERHHPPPGWQATDSAPHHCGSEGDMSKNQVNWWRPTPYLASMRCNECEWVSGVNQLLDTKGMKAPWHTARTSGRFKEGV